MQMKKEKLAANPEHHAIKKEKLASNPEHCNKERENDLKSGQ